MIMHYFNYASHAGDSVKCWQDLEKKLLTLV